MNNTNSTTTNSTTNSNSTDIPSSDILHLLQSHLIECGLQTTSSTLKVESGGVGLPGLFPTSKTNLLTYAHNGQWGDVLQLLDSLDLERVEKSYLDDYYFSRSKKQLQQHDDDGINDGGANSNNNKIITPLERVTALVHEMTILELADSNEIELAYATLRMCSEMIDTVLSIHDNADNFEEGEDGEGEGGGSKAQQQQQQYSNNNSSIGMISSRSGDIERRITALSSMRRSSAATANNSTQLLPTNYYGTTTSTTTKQKQRDAISKLLQTHVPEIQPKRLSTLLQQSLKWQCHTGTFPTVQRLFQNNDVDDNNDEEGVGDEGEGEDNNKKKKKKKRSSKKHTVEQKFDLILGNVDIATSSSNGSGGDINKKKRHKKDGTSGTLSTTTTTKARIPSRVHQSIRLGKKSYIESACFFISEKGGLLLLVTGSSDGFIEVWGEPIMNNNNNNDNNNNNKSTSSTPLLPQTTTEVNYEKLNTSTLQYQQTDDLMMHPNSSSILSMTTSNDGTLLGTTDSNGTICVWKISDGKLLRKIDRAHGGVGGVSDKGAAVTCIQFSPDGSKVLTGGHDSTCREFGLLTSRMLKEFRGHASYVNCCAYVTIPYSAENIGGGGDDDDVSRLPSTGNNSLLLVVVTASADGSVRVWNGRTAEPIRVINPPISTSANSMVHDKDSIVSSKSVHTVLHLHSPPNTMIVVPRCDKAYLMSYSGNVLRVYTRDDVQDSDFLAANVSSSNQYLFVAASDGCCVVFDVSSGNVEKIIRSFAEECSSGRSEKPCEISGIVCHPHGGFVGGYSNDKGQKRGILTLWK